jgi:hypothetical protein
MWILQPSAQKLHEKISISMQINTSTQLILHIYEFFYLFEFFLLSIAIVVIVIHSSMHALCKFTDSFIHPCTLYRLYPSINIDMA